MFAPQSKHLLVILATSLEFISWLGTGAFPTSDFTNGDATSYLKTFGWLDSNHTNNAVKIRKSMEEFQAFQGIPTTGHLDAGTIEIMKSPRCGVRDKPNGIGDIIFGSPRWRVMNLTYKISKYPTSLQTLGGQDRIDEEIKKAFAVWEAATLFIFTPSTERVDIDISFETKQHIDGPNFSFDGPAMNLAYASFHPSGVIRFNDEQHWTLESNQGINFLQVAVHEIGHALGLSHSNVGNTLMFPTYVGFMSNFRLHSDDIRSIMMLYGINSQNNRPTSSRSRPQYSGPPPRKSHPSPSRPARINLHHHHHKGSSVNESETRYPGGRSGFLPAPRGRSVGEQPPRRPPMEMEEREWDDPIVLREAVPSRGRPSSWSRPSRVSEGNLEEISLDESNLQRRWDRQTGMIQILGRPKSNIQQSMEHSNSSMQRRGSASRRAPPTYPLLVNAVAWRPSSEEAEDQQQQSRREGERQHYNTMPHPRDTSNDNPSQQGPTHGIETGDEPQTGVTNSRATEDGAEALASREARPRVGPTSGPH
ncbi:unnamed protein product [Orchesella dallaii]|uniref:Peptidase metallopeptidase domain-containing protein n=1 Tax=Orchesella dallaii TaxID=48710 RepID=A0ABP1RYW9_9HEXA